MGVQYFKSHWHALQYMPKKHADSIGLESSICILDWVSMRLLKDSLTLRHLND